MLCSYVHPKLPSLNVHCRNDFFSARRIGNIPVMPSEMDEFITNAVHSLALILKSLVIILHMEHLGCDLPILPSCPLKVQTSLSSIKALVDQSYRCKFHDRNHL